MKVILTIVITFTFIIVNDLIPSHAMTISSADTSARTWNFPQHYIQNDVQTQLAEYRRIYDPIAKMDGVSFKTTHIPGLFNVLSNGFALVANYIKNNTFFHDEQNADNSGIYMKKSKDKQYELLEKLYYISQVLENEQRMTQNNFIIINKILAILLDEYKGVTLGSHRPSGDIPMEDDELESVQEPQDDGKSKDTEEVEDQFIKYDGMIEPYLISASFMLNSLRAHDAGHYKSSNEIEAILDKDIYVKWWFDKDNEGNIIDERFNPPAIIYTKLKVTSIAPGTFVDQLLSHDYGLGLLLFKTESYPDYRPITQKQREHFKHRKPVHFGIFNGTFNLLNHDLSHNNEQHMQELYIKRNFKFDWRHYLVAINKLRLNTDRDINREDYLILTNGLFLLSHELANITHVGLFDGNGKYLLDYYPIRGFWNLFSLVARIMQVLVEDRYSLSYKEDYRDHEFILRDLVDSSGNPYLPFNNKIRNKIRELKNKFELEANEIEESNVPDAQDQIKKLRMNFKKQASQIKEKLISKGYGMFWNRFEMIAENASFGGGQ